MATPLRALIIEDSEEDARLLAGELKRGGYAVVYERAETYEAMARELREKTWDLVISDYILPCFSGLSALSLLKESGTELPLIIVSGLAGEEKAVEAMQAGAHDYILKEKLSRLVPAVDRELQEAEVRRKQKQAEEALEESELRYRRLVESLTDYIYTVQVENGLPVSTYHGPGCVSVTGYTSKEYDSDPYLWYQMVYEEDRWKVMAQAKKVLLGEPVPPLEHRIVHKDGSIRWVRNTTVSRYNKQNILTAYDGLVTDITGRKRAEEELSEHAGTLEEKVKERTSALEAAIQEAEAANRAKSDFLANMSHELRTPLNSIIGFSEVIMDGLAGPLTNKQKEFINDIYESGKHLLALINDILDLTKIESGKMELEMGVFQVKKLLEASLAMFREKGVKHDIRMCSDISEDVEYLSADERKIKQVVFNLLSNALKFTPDSGSVRVCARKVAEEAGNFVEISVEDTGIGISEEDKKKLFQPFQQLEAVLTKKSAGTGLGLNLCKKIVELHNGRIWVESEPGKGSRFTFTIPFSPP